MRLVRYVALASLCCGGWARADQGDEVQLTLPSGKVLLDVELEINLSKDAVFEPFSIAPDLWYGATDDLSLGIIHSGVGRTGLYGKTGDGLCLTGSDHGCPKVYDNLALVARYGLRRGEQGAWAVEGGLYAQSFDPFALAVGLGLIGRWQSDRLALEVAPRFFLGLSERGAANKETVVLPVTGYFGLCARVAIALQLGLVLPLEDLSDDWALALALGPRIRATEKLTFDVVFALPVLAGGDGLVTGGKVRSLTVGVGYAF